MPDLSIVIVSFNVRDLLKSCLESVFNSRGDITLEVLVVDNSSTDGSALMVRELFPQVRLLESAVNGGYAFGNNIALREILRYPESEQPKYVLLLNPDTTLPPSALTDMAAFMESHQEAGAAGPRLIRPDGRLDLACRRSFPSPEVSFYRLLGLSKLFPKSRLLARYNLTYLDPRDVVEVDSVVGAFMMVRRDVLARVGLLDESFFMYGEDLDWAYRIKECGWKVLYNGRVEVVHHKGESSKQKSNRSTVEFYRAMLVFYRKHYARTTAFPMSCLIVGAIYCRAALALAGNNLRLWFAKPAIAGARRIDRA